jgi:hypothetical protein
VKFICGVASSATSHQRHLFTRYNAYVASDLGPSPHFDSDKQNLLMVKKCSMKNAIFWDVTP